MSREFIINYKWLPSVAEIWTTRSKKMSRVGHLPMKGFRTIVFLLGVGWGLGGGGDMAKFRGKKKKNRNMKCKIILTLGYLILY